MYWSFCIVSMHQTHLQPMILNVDFSYVCWLPHSSIQHERDPWNEHSITNFHWGFKKNKMGLLMVHHMLKDLK